MTPGSREGIGVDGRRNSSRKLEGCGDDEEEESGDPGNGGERDTKGDDGGTEILHPSAVGSPRSAPPVPLPSLPGPGSAQLAQTSAEPTPTPAHDQHHFLRSSVRPPSKRIRKDSVNGHGGAKSKGNPLVIIVSSLLHLFHVPVTT